jgi:predicted nucleic acid-binding protein
VSRRKYKLDWPAISDLIIELAANFSIYHNTPATILRATHVAQRYGFSWFDSLIVAAALECGCQTLYTEDLQAGQTIDGTLVVINPFV